ncbi:MULTISPECIES: hypothetical protein [Weeksella]|uniref:hypothetical protein n=1 Tax=Weeksella TaxID=1013 RepID=UPI0008A488E2|nr:MULTISPECIES: hypothetical protein [Weeksella]MDK7375979.1 hypothetical protein [Weeksella virosa]OFM84573.1 hypothetical protein HMPREF2660_08665 [Weeksella sp. HMSC059D05]
MNIDNITLDDIYDFINTNYGNKKIIPEEKIPVMQYMELLDKIRAMDLRIGEYGSRDHIIRHLMKEGLSRYKASKAYEDAMEFYYCDQSISRDALRNRIAQKIEAQINAALLMANNAKDTIAAIKLWKDVFTILGLDKEDPPKYDPASSGKMVALYSYNMKELGLESVVDKEKVRKFIQEAPLTDAEKEYAMRQALILPNKFLNNNTDVNQSE